MAPKQRPGSPLGRAPNDTNGKTSQSRARLTQGMAGVRNPLVGPRPEPNLHYGKGKALQVKAWLRQVPPESALEVREFLFASQLLPAALASRISKLALVCIAARRLTDSSISQTTADSRFRSRPFAANAFS